MMPQLVVSDESPCAYFFAGVTSFAIGFAPAKVSLSVSPERDHFSRMVDRRSAATEPGPVVEARERIIEIGQILAAGLVRLSVRQSSQTKGAGGERSLDCVGHRSGHANPETEKA
jgi:hypothetical protein